MCSGSTMGQSIKGRRSESNCTDRCRSERLNSEFESLSSTLSRINTRKEKLLNFRYQDI